MCGGRSNQSDGSREVEVIKVHLDQSNIADMYVAKHEPNLGLEEEGSSKTFRMRLTAVRVDVKKETVDAE